MNTQAQSYDAVSIALARAIKSPEQLAMDRRLFRIRARHDARTVMLNYRSKAQFFSNVETLLYCFGQPAFNPDLTLDQVIYCLGRALGLATSYNMKIAVRSRLVQARYFRRFGFTVLS